MFARGVSMRARDAGLSCGSLPVGEGNNIADMPGVTVGHATLLETEAALRQFCRMVATCSVTRR